MTGAFRILAIAIFASAALSTGVEAAPAQLRGKSVIVSWTENRMQRIAGEGAAFQPRTVSHEFRVYVSSADRVFSRLININSQGKSGAADRVGAGGGRVPSFKGQSMTIALTGNVRGARLISVDFSAGFDSCTANVIRGKEVGAETMVARSIISGKSVEIQSVTVSGVSCSMRPGNVFGGEG